MWDLAAAEDTEVCLGAQTVPSVVKHLFAKSAFCKVGYGVAVMMLVYLWQWFATFLWLVDL